MGLPPVNNWVICTAGFLQGDGVHSGVAIIQDEIYRKCADKDTRVALRAWNDSPSAIAERIWERRPALNVPPRVVLIGYSYGGFSTVAIAKKLAERGIPVEVMVLSDAVWRIFSWLPSPSSMFSWWKIEIPSNVKRVFSYKQKTNKPQGHTIKLKDKVKTILTEVMITGRTHQYMDELPEFMETCLRVACSGENEL